MSLGKVKIDSDLILMRVGIEGKMTIEEWTPYHTYRTINGIK